MLAAAHTIAHYSHGNVTLTNYGQWLLFVTIFLIALSAISIWTKPS